MKAPENEPGSHWDEPVIVSTVDPADRRDCDVVHDCDEPAEWLCELAGWTGSGEPPRLQPTRWACMAHVGWVMGELLKTHGRIR